MQRSFNFVVWLLCLIPGFLLCYILHPANGGKVENFIDSEDREYERANAAVPEQTNAVREGRGEKAVN
jgi:hypothetical protein